MIPAIKAEFLKVFTIRSTYIFFGVVAILLALFGFYIYGWKIDNSDLHNPATLMTGSLTAVSIVSIFVGLIAVLLVSQEYRFNTIMNTLTLSNSRNKVLLAKILVMSSVSIIFAFIIAVLAPLLSIWGIHVHHLKLVHQQFPVLNVLWRCVFYGWGYTMLALLIAVLIRNQIGSIVTLLVVPGTVEELIGLLVKKNIVYFPFDALKSVVSLGQYSSNITPLHAAMVFMAYIIGGGAIGWVLFLKRDAN